MKNHIKRVSFKVLSQDEWHTAVSVLAEDAARQIWHRDWLMSRGEELEIYIDMTNDSPAMDRVKHWRHSKESERIRQL